MSKATTRPASKSATAPVIAAAHKPPAKPAPPVVSALAAPSAPPTPAPVIVANTVEQGAPAAHPPMTAAPEAKEPSLGELVRLPACCNPFPYASRPSQLRLQRMTKEHYSALEKLSKLSANRTLKCGRRVANLQDVVLHLLETIDAQLEYPTKLAV